VRVDTAEEPLGGRGRITRQFVRVLNPFRNCDPFI